MNKSVEYNPNGGTISIDAQQNNEEVFLNISYTGIGVNETQLQHLFD